MVWLFLLLSFLGVGGFRPVLGQGTAGILVKYKNGKIEELKNSQKMVTTMSGIGGSDDVLYTQPNYQYEQYEISDSDKKWFLENNGQIIVYRDGMNVSGKSGADAGLKKANDILNGAVKQPVIVAIIDSGVDYTHPFLANKMWDGGNCVDELGNKLGGCIGGYDFGDKDKDPTPDTSLSEERAYHGTHVAGIVGMMADNVKIMALKSSLTSGEIAKAIAFAKNNGAKIINASWGIGYSGGYGYKTVYDRAMYEAISGFDGIFVNAAGNDGINHDCGLASCMPFPAVLKNKTDMGEGLKNMVIVGASDYYDDLVYFSNYGKNNVDLGAPGFDIYSTVGNGGYRYFSGSSMATPTVAGAIGYVWGWKNNLTKDQVMDYIINSGQKLESLNGVVRSGRRLDLEMVVKRINGDNWEKTADSDEDGVVSREGDVGSQISMFIDTQGIPVFLYTRLFNHENNEMTIEFYRDGKTKTIEKAKSVIAMAKDKNDYPVIFVSNEQIKFIKCNDKNCDNKTEYFYDSLKPYLGKFNGAKMKIDSQNKIVLLAEDISNNFLYLLKCSDENCTTIDKTEQSIAGSVKSKDWDLLVSANGEVEPVLNTGSGLKITDKKGINYWVASDGYGVKVNDVKIDQKYGVADYLSIDKLNSGGIGVAYYDDLAGDLKYKTFGCSGSADFNRDGVVNGGDYVVWRNVFIDKIINIKYNADGNCDGRVSIADYSFWRGIYLNPSVPPLRDSSP